MPYNVSPAAQVPALSHIKPVPDTYKEIMKETHGQTDSGQRSITIASPEHYVLR